MTHSFRTKYGQYKHDTVQVSTWLAETALRNGYTLSSAKHSNVPLDTHRSGLTAEQRRNAKKKERRKERTAKEAHGGDAGARGESPRTGVPEYVKIARHLKTVGTKIPDEVFRLMRRCIKNRRLVSEKYQPDEGVSHEYFVSVLEEVESILSTLKAEDTTRANAKPETNTPKAGHGARNPSTKDVESVANRFASLGVTGDGDGEEDDDDNEDIVLHEPQGPSEVITRWLAPKRLFGPLPTKVDGLFTVLAFLNEVGAMRQHIKSVWQAYASGKIDLVTASVTTNTALETLQEADREIMDQIAPMFGGLGMMLATLLVALEGKYVPRVRHARLLEPHEKSLQKHYEFLLIPSWQIINQAETFIHPEYIDLYDYDQDHAFNPAFATAGLPFGKYWEQAEILIHDSYLQYWTAVRAGACMMTEDLKRIMGDKDNMVYVDEMARQLGTFMHTKRLSILVLAHSQIYIDIYSRLGPGRTVAASR